MAVPYRRKPKSKSRIRRSANAKFELPNLSICPNCGTKKLPHRVCLKCGYYKDRVIIDVEKFEHRFKFI